MSTLLDAAMVDYSVSLNKRFLVASYLTASDLGAAFGPGAGLLLIETTGHSFVSWGGAAILLLTAVLVGWEYWSNSVHRRRSAAEISASFNRDLRNCPQTTLLI